MCRIASDSSSPVALFFKPGSRQAVFIRSGTVVKGRIFMSIAEPSPRARAGVVLDLLDNQEQPPPQLTQQFLSAHVELSTLRDRVKAVAFDDMAESVQVFGDKKYCFHFCIAFWHLICCELIPCMMQGEHLLVW
jgi:hypothetical protein